MLNGYNLPLVLSLAQSVTRLKPEILISLVFLISVLLLFHVDNLLITEVSLYRMLVKRNYLTLETIFGLMIKLLNFSAESAFFIVPQVGSNISTVIISILDKII